MSRLTQQQRYAMLDEAGDVLWYVAQICSELGVRLETIASWNLYKLQMRAELGSAGWDEDAKDELMLKFWNHIQQGASVTTTEAGDEPS